MLEQWVPSCDNCRGQNFLDLYFCNMWTTSYLSIFIILSPLMESFLLCFFLSTASHASSDIIVNILWLSNVMASFCLQVNHQARLKFLHPRKENDKRLKFQTFKFKISNFKFRPQIQNFQLKFKIQKFKIQIKVKRFKHFLFSKKKKQNSFCIPSYPNINYVRLIPAWLRRQSAQWQVEQPLPYLS